MAAAKKSTKKAKKGTKKAKKGTKKAKKSKKKAAKKSTKKAKKASPRRAAKKKPMKKAAKKKAASKRKPNPAFMRPMSLSGDLSAVVGSSSLPRTEVTKRLWAYIKRHGLQDKENRRMINADPMLQKLFGGKRAVSMFEMTKLIAKHMS
jgi:chromatin remodeling complex protein RSC6